MYYKSLVTVDKPIPSTNMFKNLTNNNGANFFCHLASLLEVDEERNGTERNVMYWNGTERNGTE